MQLCWIRRVVQQYSQAHVSRNDLKFTKCTVSNPVTMFDILSLCTILRFDLRWNAVAKCGPSHRYTTCPMLLLHDAKAISPG